MGLLNRLAAKRKQPPPSPAKLERARRQRWGDDLYERLCGEGNAFDGAQAVIARAKESGAWFAPDARKADRQRFKLNRKQTKRRIAQLEKRVNGSDKSADVEAHKRPRLTRATVELDAALVASAVKKAQGGKCERIQSIARALPDVSIPQLKAALAAHGFNPSTVGIQAAKARR